MRDIGVAQGCSEGTFISFCLMIAFFLVPMTLINVVDIIRYRKGEIRFMDLSSVAKWVVVYILDDDGDGGGYA